MKTTTNYMQIIRGFILSLFLLSSNVSIAQTDPLEFATGTLSAAQQIQSYPLPRFKPGHTLNRNFNWFDIEYFSGKDQPGVVRTQFVSLSKTNTIEFYTNWNYYFNITGKIDSYGNVSSYNDTINSSPGALAAIAKRNPSYKTSAICLMNQTPLITSQNLTPDNYVRNSSGQYLDMGGNVVSGVKYFSPTAPNSTLISDGNYLKPYFQNLLNALGRPLDIMNDNGEAMYLMSLNGKVIDNDPVVKADYLNLGYPASKTTESINDYRGRKYAQQVSLYRDQFMSISPTTAYTFYGLDGQSDYRPVWPRGKAIQSKINGHHYSTGDFYLRWPDNWKAWAGAWHGLGWFADCKYFEEKAGDSLMSPFVCAGWNVDETQNPRPAQYLACLKVLSAWGSEFFYTGFFNISSPQPDSKNWAWQTVMPVYAQAITSRWEEFLRNGTLLEGDVPRYFLTTTTLQPNNPKYLFYTGDARKLVAVRKLNGANKYVITAAQMVDANTIGNAPNSSFAKFKLGNDSIKIEFRRQGSVYIYDATNTSAKVFYQLDKWHQYEHPERWTKDFELEAELADNKTGSSTLSTFSPKALDYSTFTTAVVLPQGSSLSYNVAGRTAGKRYLWIRARAKTVNTTNNISVQSSTGITFNVNCINDTVWRSYSSSTEGNRLNVDLTANNPITLTIAATQGNVEIDYIFFSQDLNARTQYTCPPTTVATITPNGTVQACSPATVALTANDGPTYQWYKDNQLILNAVQRTYTATSTGDYTVKVGTVTSSPTSVVVNSSPVKPIIAASQLTGCVGDSVTLTTAPVQNYLWSNGQTTQSIIVTASGVYSVTAITPLCGTSESSIQITLDSCYCPSATNLTTKSIFLSPKKRSLRWTPAVGAELQTLYWVDPVTNTTKFRTLSGIISQQQIGNLKPSRTYEWWVETLCRNGKTSKSTIAIFIQ